MVRVSGFSSSRVRAIMMGVTGSSSSGEAAGHCRRYVPGSLNGCGPGGWIGKLIPDAIDEGIIDFDFTDVCNRHDLCYGHKFGNYRSQCDHNFRNDMRTWCIDATQTSWWEYLAGSGELKYAKRKLCFVIADIYFDAVRGEEVDIKLPSLTKIYGIPLIQTVHIAINDLGREEFIKQQYKICPYLTNECKKNRAHCMSLIRSLAM